MIPILCVFSQAIRGWRDYVGTTALSALQACTVHRNYSSSWLKRVSKVTLETFVDN